jgi:hypothetical protein
LCEWMTSTAVVSATSLDERRDVVRVEKALAS